MCPYKVARNFGWQKFVKCTKSEQTLWLINTLNYFSFGGFLGVMYQILGPPNFLAIVTQWLLYLFVPIIGKIKITFQCMYLRIDRKKYVKRSVH